jgi:hypothetical protein
MDHELSREDLELALFLFSVCHIVIVVESEMNQLSLRRFLRTVETLKWNIPEVSIPSASPAINVSAEKHFFPFSNEYLADPGNPLPLSSALQSSSKGSICVSNGPREGPGL